MGWLTDLRGTVVGVDTAPVIYLIEEHPLYLETVRGFFLEVAAGHIQAVTSTVTLLEVLVQPFRRGVGDLVRQYRETLLHAAGFSCEPVSSEIAEEAARLRAAYNVRTPDAIQLATAILAGPSSFLTNDSFLPPVPSLKILILDQLVTLPE